MENIMCPGCGRCVMEEKNGAIVLRSRLLYINPVYKKAYARCRCKTDIQVPIGIVKPPETTRLVIKKPSP